MWLPTVLLTLHGRGESATAGNAQHFVDRLNGYLKNQSIQSLKVINIGLSDSSTDDYDWSTYRSMSYQSGQLCQQLRRPQIWQQLMNTTQSRRIVLVGFSQGGLLWRGMLWGQCLDPLLPRLDRLITFGGPHSGVFGKPDCRQMDTRYPALIKLCDWLQKFDDLTGRGPGLYDIVMYTELAELAFSAASYWNDPSSSRQSRTWLAQIDNQNNGDTNGTDKYLSRKLGRGLALIAFGNESTVLPPISSQFGSWDSMARNWLPFNETKLYTDDWIGLKQLDQNGLVQFYTIPNETHMSIPDD
ncbi:palmitoyl-protein thioesterase 1-like, partial [Oppia nitens]|uniref:palmitoyl-protein thioesterase 1-like n=1 Tax=Oppia nitens TaxID=1686743 RepID=UPI0023DAACCB